MNFIQKQYSALTWFVSILLSGFILISPSFSEEIIIFEGDQYHTISGDSASDDMTLYFGDSLEHFLMWDASTNMFVFSDDVDFTNHEIKNVRLENLTAEPTCDGSASGRIYYNSTDTHSYVCNGTDWRMIDADAAPADITPTIASLTPDSFPQYSNNTVVITGTGFNSGALVSIPGYTGLIESVTVLSPTQIKLVLKPQNTTAQIYDIVVTQIAASGNTVQGTLVDAFKVTPVVSLIPGQGGVNWTNISGVNTSVGELLPSNNGVGWNKGASFGTVPANNDFTLVFTPKYMAGTSSGGNAMIGMDNSDPNTNYNTIDYSLYFAGTNIYIYENGSHRASLGTYSITDEFKIVRESGTVRYYRNNALIHTSATSSNTSMVFDSSLYRYIGATNIQLYLGIL